MSETSVYSVSFDGFIVYKDSDDIVCKPYRFTKQSHYESGKYVESDSFDAVICHDTIITSFIKDFPQVDAVIGETTYTTPNKVIHIPHVYISEPTKGFTGPDDDPDITLDDKNFNVRVYDNGSVTIAQGTTDIIAKGSYTLSNKIITEFKLFTPHIFTSVEIDGDYFINLILAEDFDLRTGYVFSSSSTVSTPQGAFTLLYDNIESCLLRGGVNGNNTYDKWCLITGSGNKTIGGAVCVGPLATQSMLLVFSPSYQSGIEIVTSMPNEITTEVLSRLKDNVDALESKIDILEDNIEGIASLTYTVR